MNSLADLSGETAKLSRFKGEITIFDWLTFFQDARPVIIDHHVYNL